MLDNIDLTRTIEKAAYQKQISELEPKLGVLQRRIRELGIPVIILFEGWGASGKGTLINSLILAMDPRGFNVYTTKPPTEEAILRPFLWRFWIKTPEKGRAAIFDRSWYGRVLGERVDNLVKRQELAVAYDEINAFERQLTNDGTVVIKFFLHISAKEQKKRFEKLESNPSTSWRVTKDDWKHHKEYDDYVTAIEEMFDRTNTTEAPWTIVEAHDQRFATIKTFETVAKSIECAIAKKLKSAKSEHSARLAPKLDVGRLSQESVLDSVDTTLTLTREEYEEKLKSYQRKMWDLEHDAYLKRLPVSIVFEGWDAAGKGSAIKRLAQGMDPRGYEVVPFAAPNDVEKQHHYLWRFWNRIPKGGHITIFDRSWYGRVLVERVEGFCSEEAWRRAYREINETEEQWANAGMVIIKFWMHIDEKEQLARFKARQVNPEKQWKITDEDWRNREKWNLYKNAVDDMINNTDKVSARWVVVEATSKLFARIKVLKTVISTIEDHL